MINGLDHIAIIVSSEKGVDFYKQLGFAEISRVDRGYDVLIFLTGYGITLEVFIDANHPKRASEPEAMGLRHLALKVDNIEDTVSALGVTIGPIKEVFGKRLAFCFDPDGLPVEFHE